MSKKVETILYWSVIVILLIGCILLFNHRNSQFQANKQTHGIQN